MDFSILVGSCDKYCHLWPKFSALFNKYWDHKIKVKKYIITQTLDVNIDGFETIKVKDTNFTTGLKNALDYIKEESILWLQDDYFLIKTISHSTLLQYYALFINNSMDRLGIHPVSRFYSVKCHDGILQFLQNSKYTTSLQASFWNKKFMYKIANLIKDEDIWNFETKGSDIINLVHKHKIFLIPQSEAWYVEACRKGNFTDDYYSICEKEGISINDIYKSTN